MPERYPQLDALRGLAALTVVMQHFLSVLPVMVSLSTNPWVNILQYSPLHIAWAGYEAVIFFFILSGFVLSLPFYGEKNIQYSSYLFKRICRIYIPYLVSILIVMLVFIVFSKGGFVGASDWFNGLFVKEFSWNSLLQHLLLIGLFDYKSYNPVVWSLIHEMRISLIFPFIMYFVVNRLNWKVTLIIAFFLSALGSLLNNRLSTPETVAIHYYITIHYIAMFLVGALLAKHRVYWMVLFQNLQKRVRMLSLLLALSAYSYSYWFFPGIASIHLRLIDNWVICIGAVLFIMFSLTSKSAAKFFSKSALLFIGKTSYSIYLYHLIVLYICMHLFFGVIPLWSLFIIAFILTLLISKLAYSQIELPAITLGKWGAKWLTRSGTVKKASVKSTI